MKIERLELRLLKLPLVHFFETSFSRVHDKTFILVRVAGEGLVGYGEWANGTGRWPAPTEVTHEQLWMDFVAGDWPPAARAGVGERATELTYRMGELGQAWRLRRGMAELLAFAADRGMPVAVVSNTLHGRVHRDYLATVGLAHLSAASDETAAPETPTGRR